MKNQEPPVSTPVSVAPKQVPVKCVVCEGWGSFSHGQTPCKACEAKGYLMVDAVVVKENPKGGGANLT